MKRWRQVFLLMRNWMSHFIQMSLPTGQTSKPPQSTTVAKLSFYCVHRYCHVPLLFPNMTLLSIWSFAEVAALKVFLMVHIATGHLMLHLSIWYNIQLVAKFLPRLTCVFSWVVLKQELQWLDSSSWSWWQRLQWSLAVDIVLAPRWEVGQSFSVI